MPLATRFWRKVTVQTEQDCWKWQGAQNGDGYGIIGYGGRYGKTMRAHRLSWELHNKTKIPSDLCVCHHCDNPSCVNPAHLFLGTNKDNVDDMRRKGRRAPNHAFAKKGEANGRAILTEANVCLIREWRRDSGITQGELAQQYGVSRGLIEQILARKLWKHVAAK